MSDQRGIQHEILSTYFKAQTENTAALIQMMIRYGILLNGAAAAGVLTMIGHIAVANDPALKVSQLGAPVTIFAFGALLSLVASFFAFFAQRNMALKTMEHAPQYENGEINFITFNEKIFEDSSTKFLRKFSIWLIVAGYLAFVAGSALASFKLSLF